MENLNLEFEAKKCCVLIPTFNNCHTIKKVIDDCLIYTNHILVVNDGSTDHTSEILKTYKNINIINHTVNQGKGKALRTGFEQALQLGYSYAITLDSDGQHFAKDIPLFLQKIDTNPNAIIIGDRNMNQEGIPSKSSFGNKFSSFWYQIETGYKLPDTQSGFRLYPLVPLSKLHFYTKKFEFEIEVIVRGAWHGLEILPLPISVYYAPAGERISHFRPFKDFTRISILNTIFVTLALLWYRPLMLIRDFKKKSFKTILNEIFQTNDSTSVKAKSIGLGIFIGIFPIWGFQMLTGFYLSHVFKLNKALVILASNISIPPLLPFILYASYAVGALIFNEPILHFNNMLSFKEVTKSLLLYVTGATLFAIVSGVVAYLLSFLILDKYNKK